jgi:hypothetical protein
MSADKPTNAGERKVETRPETRSDELAAAHAYLDQLMVYRPGAGDRSLTLEERLRALFGDRPAGAAPQATAEERLCQIEGAVARLTDYVLYQERHGNARLKNLESAVNGLTLSQISAIPRELTRL